MSNTFFPEDLWKKLLKGWLITDCSVRERTVVYLCLRENIPHEKASLMWDHDIGTKFLVMDLKQPDEIGRAHV